MSMLEDVLLFILTVFVVGYYATQVDIQINTEISNRQGYPEVASLKMTSTNRFIVTWSSLHSGYWDIQGQLYDFDGIRFFPFGSEFRINSVQTGWQLFQDVCALPTGGFVVAWEDDNEGDSYGIHAGSFDNNGVSITGDVRINQNTAGPQRMPRVSCLPNGDVAIIWTEVFLTVLDGKTLERKWTEDQTVNEDSGSYFDLTWTQNGNVAVVWVIDNSVFLAEWDKSTGAKLTENILLNPTTFNQGGQTMVPSIATFPNGDLGVVWARNTDIVCKLLDSNYLDITPEFFANLGASSTSQGDPFIAIIDEDRFVVTWTDREDYPDVKLQVFSKRAGRVSTYYRANFDQSGYQYYPAATVLSNGSFFVAWHEETGTDGNSYGVFGSLLHYACNPECPLVDSDCEVCDPYSGTCTLAEDCTGCGPGAHCSGGLCRCSNYENESTCGSICSSSQCAGGFNCLNKSNARETCGSSCQFGGTCSIGTNCELNEETCGGDCFDGECRFGMNCTAMYNNDLSCGTFCNYGSCTPGRICNATNLNTCGSSCVDGQCTPGEACSSGSEKCWKGACIPIDLSTSSTSYRPSLSMSLSSTRAESTTFFQSTTSTLPPTRAESTTVSKSSTISFGNRSSVSSSSTRVTATWENGTKIESQTTTMNHSERPNSTSTISTFNQVTGISLQTSSNNPLPSHTVETSKGDESAPGQELDLLTILLILIPANLLVILVGCAAVSFILWKWKKKKDPRDDKKPPDRYSQVPLESTAFQPDFEKMDSSVKCNTPGEKVDGDDGTFFVPMESGMTTPRLEQTYSELPPKDQLGLMQSGHYIDYSELEFREKLGEGQFGTVWKAIWKRTLVACKKMNSSSTKAEMAEFIAEAKIHKEIPPNRNLVQFLGISSGQSNELCIIAEFVPRGSLAAYLSSSEIISPERSFEIIKGIAAGMAHLHVHHIIHRDLASRNVLISNDWTAKVADFGMSRMVVGNQDYVTTSKLLPLKWLAPECIREQIFNTKTDVWSFGDAMTVATSVGYSGLTLDIPKNAPPLIASVSLPCPSVPHTLSRFFPDRGGLLYGTRVSPHIPRCPYDPRVKTDANYTHGPIHKPLLSKNLTQDTRWFSNPLISDFIHLFDWMATKEEEEINIHGLIPLHAACMCGRHEIVEMLLKRGSIDLINNQQLDSGRTPLNIACLCGKEKVVEVLLRHGASLTMRDKWGNTPLDSARRWGYDDIVFVISKEEDRRRNVGNVGCHLLRASRAICGSLDFPIEIQRVVLSFFDEDRVLSDQQIKDVIDFGFDFASLSNNSVSDKQQFISQMKLEF